jgi:hypothetical protein
MREYALIWDREVARVVRKDHHGDKFYWLVQPIGSHPNSLHLQFVPANRCELLDPALNVLFEREENE